MAGTGKSTVAISVASKLRSTSNCLASFFFRRGLGDLAYVQKLVPTIARQFSRSSPTYRRLVLKVIEADPDLGQSVNLRDQYERLMLEPLRILQSSVPAPDPFFAVIDALDECDQETDLRLLLRLFAKAAQLFIFAATACRYIGESPLADPQERLEQICHAPTQNCIMTKELDQMYTIILESSIRGEYTDYERQRIAHRFHRVIGSVILLFSPLSLPELHKLLRDAQLSDQRQAQDILRLLHAVIDVPQDNAQSVQPLHLSFRDFLLDHNRCYLFSGP